MTSTLGTSQTNDHERRTAPIVLRIAIGLAGVAALAVTRIASSSTNITIDVLLLGVILTSAAFPDTHVGLAVVLLLSANWVVSVDQYSPWILGLGIAIAIFHVASAASSTSPFPAVWSPGVARHWSRRAAVICLSPAVVWVAAHTVDRVSIQTSPWFALAGFLAISAGVLWVGRKDRE